MTSSEELLVEEPSASIQTERSALFGKIDAKPKR
jgi:hypothetical protein